MNTILELADCTWNCTHPQPILTILNLLELPLYNNVRKHNNSDAGIVDELSADEQAELQMKLCTGNDDNELL